MALDSLVVSIKGIGSKSAEGFDRMGLHTVKDLLYYFPRTYEKFEEIKGVRDFVPMQRNAVMGSIIAPAKIIRYSGKSVVTAYVRDENGDSFEIKFFNAAYLAKTLKTGTPHVFRGFVTVRGATYSMIQPQMYKPEEYPALAGTIGPIYSATKDVSAGKIKKAVLSSIGEASRFTEYLTGAEIADNNFLTLEESFKNIHFPENEIKLYNARRRLVFEEFLSFYHAIKCDDAGAVKLPNPHPFVEVADCVRLEQSLPYELTNAQKEAVRDIFNDMTGPFLMNRLLQGDVGSGKTIVAMMALLMCAANNAQGALMAPTEVLAVQHFNNIKEMCEKYKLCVRPVLLHGKLSKKDRDKALLSIESGEANVVIGTHALFQEGVKFKDLKLVITDEQHRFGVNQREGLRDKGIDTHILVMSATPIPRTLAMVLYGNVDISVMNELPKNRIPIKNAVVDSSYAKKSLEFIRKEIKAGHQAYVICPMIDESESDDLNLKNVITYSEELREYYGNDARIACLHGKLKGSEKENIMENFKAGNFDILVSTTVVEVGVDVPNATVIMIENAERFGLSQLHQLRGRVGRGNAQSYCILVSDSKSDATRERLKVLNETNDGFEIARRDIKLRGPGELAGVRQSGALSFGIGDIMEDSDIFMLVIDMYDGIKERIKDRDNTVIDFRKI